MLFYIKTSDCQDEKIIFRVCGSPKLLNFLYVFTEKQLVFGAFCCLFQVVLSVYLPDFSHKCILKQYYINDKITHWIGWRLFPECPHAYWITKPAIEICSSYVPITTCWEGSNLRGCSLRLSRVLKHYQALFISTDMLAVMKCLDFRHEVFQTRET